jgi:hypothetical protein
VEKMGGLDNGSYKNKDLESFRIFSQGIDLKFII